jgi:putative DNA primase/helicase
MNQVQIQQEFKGFLIDTIGYAPETILGDSTLHRIKDNQGKPNGAYVLHLDGVPAGYCEDWKTGLKVNWKAEGNYPKLTEAQRTEFKLEQQKQQQLRNAEEKQRHNGAAQKAAYIEKQTKPVPQHSYITKKRIKPHNARLYKDALVIPILNEGELVSLQFIDKDGNKRFLTGGKLKGSYSQLGIYDANKPILICEGWATGASLYESTDNLTYVALFAKNLKEVAIYVRSLYRHNEIIICGDNDVSGVGQAAAREAALAIGGKYLIPETIGFDWNDAVNAEVSV